MACHSDDCCKFKIEEANEELAKTALWSFKNVSTIDGTPQQIFRIFNDKDAWPVFFREVTVLEWNTRGAGETRKILLNDIISNIGYCGRVHAWEKFYIWEENRRFAFTMTHFSRPRFLTMHQMIEDYQFEEAPGNKCKFTPYTSILLLSCGYWDAYSNLYWVECFLELVPD